MLASKKMVLFIINMYGNLNSDFQGIKFRNSLKSGPSVIYDGQAFLKLNLSIETYGFDDPEIAKATLKKLIKSVGRYDEYDLIMRKLPDYEGIRKFGECLKILKGGTSVEGIGS